VRTADYFHVPIFLKSGSLNLLVSYGPVQACNGIALLLPLYPCSSSVTNVRIYALAASTRVHCLVPSYNQNFPFAFHTEKRNKIGSISTLLLHVPHAEYETFYSQKAILLIPCLYCLLRALG
jgi:hypothetical protein